MHRFASLLATALSAASFLCCVQIANACPPACACWWKSGKEMVRCSGVAAVPNGLAATTQVIDLSGNKLKILPAEVFLRNHLLHLQRIYLAHCRLATIHATAFARLSNLVELDLSDNELATVPSDTFVHFPDLRRLSLAGNPLATLDANAFRPLSSLTSLELSHCRLETVEEGAFDGLRSLTQLKLDGNLLRSLDGEVVSPLDSLHAFHLHDNPWHCDCQLRELHRWLLDRRLHQSAPPALCTGPPNVQGEPLDKLTEVNLACQPRGAYVHRRVEALEGDDALLLCKVTADPEARIQWQWDGRPITNLSFAYPSAQMFLIREFGNINKTSSLRISGVSHHNAGQYMCLAHNVAGRFSITVSLHVVALPYQEVEVHIGQVVGIFLAVMATTMVLVVLCALCIRLRHMDSKQFKGMSLVKLGRSLRPVRNRRFERAHPPELQSLKNSNSTKRPISPDAMTFLVNDFGIPQSPNHPSRVQDNRPDVIHVIEPLYQGKQCDDNGCHSGGCSQSNENSNEESVHSDSCNVGVGSCDDAQCEEKAADKIDNSDKDLCYGESDKPSKSNIDAELIDKIKWSESFSSSHDLAEEIEMKVHLDHLSAESTWKQSNLSLSKFAATANSEWLSDEQDTYNRGSKPYPESSWWESHELPPDNSYNICIYEKSPSEKDVSVASDCTIAVSLSKANSSSSLEPLPEPSLSPDSYPPSFPGLMYDTRETDL